jgi:nucleotide-binding universal stress UspA family protein
MSPAEAREDGPSPLKILVAIDGSAASLRAADHAVSLLRRGGGGEIALVNVQGPETLDVSDISAVMSIAADRERAEAQAKTALNKAVELCRKAGVVFTTRIEIGPIAETIARLAREIDADQIVMGTRGLGAIRRLVLGSTAGEVVRLAEIPVTLVK